MNKQEIFDKVATHAATQAEKALVDGGPLCAYRGQNGTSCFVGCLIPDERYSTDLEGDPSTGNAVVDALGMRAEMTPDGEEFIHDLQTVHDGYAPSEWHASLTAVAAHHDLSTDHLETLDWSKCENERV